MTIPVQVPFNQYVASGTNDTFTFTFRILDNEDLIVSIDGEIQVETIDYDVVGVTDLGGDVVFLSNPDQDELIVLVREIPVDQDVVYTPFDPFPAKSHEGALDKLTMIIQDAFVRTLTRTGEGLPLDPTGQFWDALSKRIRNVVAPALSTDVANKAYVDSQVGNPFDPSANENITGVWSFSQVITGITTGNLVASSLDPYPIKNAAEAITGAWTVADGGGSARKIAARNPRHRELVADDIPIQADEGIILRVQAPITSIILAELEAQTTFSIFAKASGYTLVEGPGVTINHYDGLGITPPTGDRIILRASVIDVVYESSTEISIYGNGIT